MNCLGCSRLTARGNCCPMCRKMYTDAWCVGSRTEVLERLINQFKFERVRAADAPLADLLAHTIGQLPVGTVVVPVPTIHRHVRERGYDHMRLIAKRLAERRNWRVATFLRRQTQTVQRGASATQRKDQAKKAFSVGAPLDNTVPYLVIDDVMTTGATLQAAVAALRAAGANRVYVAVIARQPLDDRG